MVAPEVRAVGWFAAAVLFAWSPLLGVERLRALFEGPTPYHAVNYLLVGAAVLAGQVCSYLIVLLLVAGTGQVTGGDAAALLGGIAVVNLALPGACAVAAVRILPHRGAWTPDGEGIDGRIALAIGVVWYAIVATAMVVLIGLVVLFTNLPT